MLYVGCYLHQFCLSKGLKTMGHERAEAWPCPSLWKVRVISAEGGSRRLRTDLGQMGGGNFYRVYAHW